MIALSESLHYFWKILTVVIFIVITAFSPCENDIILKQELNQDLSTLKKNASPLAKVKESYLNLTLSLVKGDSTRYGEHIKILTNDIKNVEVSRLTAAGRAAMLSFSNDLLSDLQNYPKQNLRAHFFLNPIQAKLDSIMVCEGLLQANRIKGKVVLELLKGGKVNTDMATARSYYLIGFFNMLSYQNFIANKYFLKALGTKHSSEDVKFRIGALINLGITYFELEMYPKAYRAYGEVYAIAKQNDDLKSMAKARLEMSMLELNSKNYQEAIEMGKESLEIFRKQNDSILTAVSLLNLAKISLEDGDGAAENWAVQALDRYYKNTDLLGAAQAMACLSKIYANRNNFHKSNVYIQQALGLQGVENHSYTSNWLKIQQVSNYIHQDKLDDVPKMLENVLNGLKKSEQNYTLLGFYYDTKMDYLARIGNFTEYKTAKEFKDQMRQEVEATRTKNMLSEIVEEKKWNTGIVSKWTYKTTIALILMIISIGITTVLLYNLLKDFISKKESVEDIEKDENSLSEIGGEISAGRSNASDGDKSFALFLSIEEQVSSNLLFLNANLAISDLSKLLQTNEKYISASINSYGGTNFNVYVNRYRIEFAKCLIESAEENFSIKEISFKSGFNNHTTFYRQFKDLTGFTPSEYLRKNSKF